MMRIYSGTVKAPASKSSSLRALICCALSENDNSLVIHNISRCDDVLAGIELVRELRLFTTILDNDSLTFTSNIDKLRERDSLICNVGESGFLARAFVSIANHFTSKVTLIGKGTLLKRDLGIAEFADKIGLSACNSKLPTTIQGKIKPGKFVVTEKRSSQFLSGLLFILPLLTEDSMVTIEELVSRPYIDLTLSYLARCGIKYEWVSKNKIAIPGKQSYIAKDLRPESDWSSLSFLIALGIMGGDITITDLCDCPNLPDRIILDLLNEIGGDFSFINDKTLKVKKSVIQGFTFDLTSNPDLAPVLVALAISATSPCNLKNCYRLRDKESDRLVSLMDMLKSLSVEHKYYDDTLTIFPTQLSGGYVKTYDDHRIAMTALILNTISRSKITIDNYQCINKSYPDFLNDLNRLGVEI